MHEGHTHDHGHGHEHDHGHGHGHEHTGAERRLALLKYMLDHNRHHAGELAEAADGLEADGAAEAARLIREGVAKLGEGNDSLERAIKLLEEGKEEH